MLQITTRPYWLKPGFDPATYKKQQREKQEIAKLKRRFFLLTGSKPTKKNVLKICKDILEFNPKLLMHWQGAFAAASAALNASENIPG
jgi:hypothetical protein